MILCLVRPSARTALVCIFSGLLRTALLADIEPSAETIRAAVVKSVPFLETGARGSMEKRKQCFTCHHQAVPVMALTLARSRGLAIDEDNLRKQVQFTADFLAKNRTSYMAGEGQCGQALTAGYALWTLEVGGWKPDATTESVTEYLLDAESGYPHGEDQVHLECGRRLGDSGPGVGAATCRLTSIRAPTPASRSPGPVLNWAHGHPSITPRRLPDPQRARPSRTAGLPHPGFGIPRG